MVTLMEKNEKDREATDFQAVFRNRFLNKEVVAVKPQTLRSVTFSVPAVPWYPFSYLWPYRAFE